MGASFKTRDVAKSLYVNYLKRSQECLNAARNSSGIEHWNASAINAIHSAIAACDAICVYFLGKRSAGDNHNDAVNLFKTIKIEKGEEISTNANRILRILRVKNTAEYEDRLIHKSEAEKILRDCEKFFAYVKRKLL